MRIVNCIDSNKRESRVQHHACILAEVAVSIMGCRRWSSRRQPYLLLPN